ncbi:formimidoylglutamase, partial [Pseudomonas fragi]|nr:formimidoylglutamase [Pseudomonas sp. GC01]
MTMVPEMQVWTGRVDAAEGQGALRWHQWVKPFARSQPAGAALIGLACDEGVKRNQGRTG